MRKQDIIASSKRSSPDAPAITSAVDIGINRAYNDARIDLIITPGFDGKLPITEYFGISTPGSLTGTSPTSSVQITGLLSSTSYTFTGTVSNIIGPSSSSLPTLPVIATTVPQRPIAGTASIPSNQSYGATANSSIPFTAGANGGKAITSFTITSSSGATAVSASSPVDRKSVV